MRAQAGMTALNRDSKPLGARIAAADMKAKIANTNNILQHQSIS
jgi:hypothetical protein